MRAHHVFASVLVLLLAQQAAAWQSGRVEVAAVGYSGSAEQAVRDGELWWGLFVRSGRSSELREITARVDAGPVKRVSANGADQPLFLFRSDQDLFRGGRVATVYSSGGALDSEIVDRRDVPTRDGSRCRVSVEWASASPSSVVRQLVLTTGGGSVVLDRAESEDARYFLEWVGDLDGDGQPDFIVRRSSPEGRRLMLFLSSAGRGLREVGDQDLASSF